MDELSKDLRYGARMLASKPGFTSVAVLSLALGIGVNTTVFTIVNAVLLRPLAFAEPERLVRIYTSTGDGLAFGTSSYPDYADLRKQADLFSGLTAHMTTILNWNRETHSELVFGEAVSASYFDVLGVEASLGRFFVPEEDRTPGAHPVIVLGHGFWRRHFGGDPEVLGQTIKLNGTDFTIVGVAPESFTGVVPVLQIDVWIPLMMQDAVSFVSTDTSMLDQRATRTLGIVGRMRPGVDREQVAAQVETVAARLAAEYPESNRERTMTPFSATDVRFHPLIDGALTPVAGLLMAVVSLVLLIACANVANMLLARAATRRREIAIRLALGAGRLRLVRQLLAESVMLALAGGGLGLVLTAGATRLLLGIKPPMPISVAVDLGIDGRVLLFTLLASVTTGVLFGLAPTLRSSRPDLVVALKDDVSRSGNPAGRFGLRNTLVVVQVAVSMVLLVAAGLFVRSLRNVQSVDLGFDVEGLAVVSTILDTADYPLEQQHRLFRELAESMSSRSDVVSVSYSERLPLTLVMASQDFTIEGREAPPGEEEVEIEFGSVGPGFFATMGIPLLAGRELTDADAEGAPPVAIVNRTFAERYWPGENPLGRRLSTEGPDGPWIEVVGVSEDYKVITVGEDRTPFVHLAFLQQDPFFQSLIVRTRGDAAAMVAAVREQMLAHDPDIVIFDAKTMRQNVNVITFPVRMAAGMLGLFGTLALALAAVGVYGVIAYAVSRRIHEIGVRMALGADGGDVVRMVLREGMGVVAVGVALGLVGAFAVTRVVAGFLYGVGVLDPVTFAVTTAVLLGSALLANWLPARRGARVDPMIALRRP